MSISTDASVFTQLRFWVLVLFSVVLPAAVFVTLFVRREFSKATVLVFGLLLIVLAGVDVLLLHALSVAARATPSLADDVVFASELSIALYILPAAFGTFGVNMVSHVLMHYLKQKEQRFEVHHAQPLSLAVAPFPPLAPKAQAGARVRMPKGVYVLQGGRPGARQALRRGWLLVDGATTARYPTSFVSGRVTRSTRDGRSPHHVDGAGLRRQQMAAQAIER